MRYVVECDTPDFGKSIYAECFGFGGKRGRILSEHDNLTEAIEACNGDPAYSTRAMSPWIWDRRIDRIVSVQRVKNMIAQELNG